MSHQDQEGKISHQNSKQISYSSKKDDDGPIKRNDDAYKTRPKTPNESKNRDENEDEDEDDDDDNEEEKKKEPMSLKMPQGSCFKRFMHVFTMPFNALTFYTIPDPVIKKRYNLLPLTFITSYLWIFAFSFFITWWMAVVSAAYDIDQQFIPFFVVPAGLIMRDVDKFQEFRDEIKLLKQTDNYIPVQEPYACSIFQFSVATSINWIIFIIAKTNISFKNKYIYAQVLLLLGIVICRFVTSIATGFKGKRRIFVIYVIIYMVYSTGVIFIQLLK